MQTKVTVKNLIQLKIKDVFFNIHIEKFEVIKFFETLHNKTICSY